VERFDLARDSPRDVLVSPYFVPRDRGVDWMRRLDKRGVRVVIVTNSLSSTDVLPVHAGYARARRALLEARVELWEIRENPVLSEWPAKRELPIIGPIHPIRVAKGRCVETDRFRLADRRRE
jgi:phosphatidylserine/phosphatidylglycerophosphate/cardiolipin synthase-like enzyme